MKNFFSALAIVGFAAFASAQTISFDKTTYEYGTVKTGSDGHRFFTVKNTGDKPLIITDVKASCGCTTPEYSKDPIMPGKTAQLKVGYNTAINGPFQKLIEVFSNDPVNSRSVIYIKGNVDPAAVESSSVKETATEVTTAKKAVKKPAAAQKLQIKKVASK